jgi:hypothetical protein
VRRYRTRRFGGSREVSGAWCHVSRTSSIRAFRQAVELLRQIDPGLSLYVASSTLCLMKGPSHDADLRPLRDNVIDSAGSLRISGGDW